MACERESIDLLIASICTLSALIIRNKLYSVLTTNTCYLNYRFAFLLNSRHFPSVFRSCAVTGQFVLTVCEPHGYTLVGVLCSRYIRLALTDFNKYRVLVDQLANVGEFSERRRDDQLPRKGPQTRCRMVKPCERDCECQRAGKLTITKAMIGR